MFVFRSYVKIVLICSSTHIHTSLKFIGFGLTGFGFHVKNVDIPFTCVLDSIHTQYASNVFQCHIFVFIQVLEKTVFHFKIQVLENTVIVFKPNFYITKIVQIVCNMC